MSTTDLVNVTEDPWMTSMRRGDFEHAWRISDALLAERHGIPCWDWPRHCQYVWDGSSLAGKRVLIRCYHGLGDTIQFIRFAALVKEVAKEVIVWAQPVLLPLLEGVNGIDRLLPLHDGVPEVEYDVDVEVMELAHVFRTTLDTVPNDVPYLRIRDEWSSECSDGKLSVGVVWCSGGWDERRSMPASQMAKLRAMDGVDLHVLQNRAAAGEWPLETGRIICPEPVTELAHAIWKMDLLITIDSLPAHLGGALGVPTWTLLPAQADWRWMDDRSDSPWYPTMRLWRQPRPGDWDSVIEAVAAELLTWAEVPRHRK
jgi:hypothetical protein